MFQFSVQTFFHFKFIIILSHTFFHLKQEGFDPSFHMHKAAVLLAAIVVLLAAIVVNAKEDPFHATTTFDLHILESNKDNKKFKFDEVINYKKNYSERMFKCTITVLCKYAGTMYIMAQQYKQITSLPPCRMINDLLSNYPMFC